ncbi:MAG: hypothetical protein S0880_09840 [Actinomycetota bacterium]|nr:hypothetical protein [Actinomycetota bacterium]
MTTTGRPDDGDALEADDLSVDDLLDVWSAPAPPGAEPMTGEVEPADGKRAAAVLGGDIVVPDRDLTAEA